jgi:hypothetical protein
MTLAWIMLTGRVSASKGTWLGRADQGGPPKMAGNRATMPLGASEGIGLLDRGGGGRGPDQPCPISLFPH